MITSLALFQRAEALEEQVLSGLKESMSSISAQLAAIAKTLDNLPAGQKNPQLLDALVQLKLQQENIRKAEILHGRILIADPAPPAERSNALAQENNSIYSFLWRATLFIVDGGLGALLYESLFAAPAKTREDLWIRRAVVGFSVAVCIHLTLVIIQLVRSEALDHLVGTLLVTLRALALVTMVIQDMVKLPSSLARGDPLRVALERTREKARAALSSKRDT